MLRSGFGRRGGSGGFEPPIELRFVDLFMIIVTALMFTTVVLSIIAAITGGGERVEPPQVLTDSLPRAYLETPYRLTLAASGGSGGYMWQLVEGGLPPSLALSKDGALQGTAQSVGQAHFRVSVTDAKGRSAVSQPLTLEVGQSSRPSPAPEDTLIHVSAPTVLLPDGSANQPYKAELAARGGMAPYSWERVEGQLPAGLSLSPEGVVSGEPTEWETPRTFKAKISDARGESTVQEFKLWVTPPPPPFWKTALWWLSLLFWGWFLWHGGGGIKYLFQAFLNRRRAA